MRKHHRCPSIRGNLNPNPRAIDVIAPDASPVSAADAFTRQGRAVAAQGDADVSAAQSAADAATGTLGGLGTIDTHGAAIGDTLAPGYRAIQDDARGQVAALGGDQPAAAYGAQVKGALDPQFRAAQDAARGQVDVLGGLGPASDRGAALRAPARDAEADAQDRLSAAYAAVPDDAAANIAPLKRLARSLYADPEPAVAQTMTPAEQGIADALGQYGNDVTFKSARAIDTMLTGAMRNELSRAGRSAARRRWARGGAVGTERTAAGGGAMTALHAMPLVEGGTVTVSPSSTVLRFPPRLRVVPTSGNPASTLDALLSAGTLDAHQHAAALAYGQLRRRLERSGGCRRSWKDTSGLSDDAWHALKRRHAALIRAAGAERFILDRLCLEDDAPLPCEMERVREALGRVAEAMPSRL